MTAAGKTQMLIDIGRAKMFVVCHDYASAKKLLKSIKHRIRYISMLERYRDGINYDKVTSDIRKIELACASEGEWI